MYYYCRFFDRERKREREKEREIERERNYSPLPLLPHTQQLPVKLSVKGRRLHKETPLQIKVQKRVRRGYEEAKGWVVDGGVLVGIKDSGGMKS